MPPPPPSPQPPPSPARPLDGLRVLDLSRALSGPFAGRILADLGADVVKVELPGADIAQTYGKMTRGRSGLYAQLNAGKRSIVLDLRLPGDVARLLDLAAVCDVVVENFRPGILDGFGAGWPALSAVNERLVMLSISGFGQHGPEASRPTRRSSTPKRVSSAARRTSATPRPPTSRSRWPTHWPGCTAPSPSWPPCGCATVPAPGSTSTSACSMR